MCKSVRCALRTKSVAALCHHATLLQYHWPYSQCCAFNSRDILISYLETCASHLPSPIFAHPSPPVATMFVLYLWADFCFLFVCLLICFVFPLWGHSEREGRQPSASQGEPPPQNRPCWHPDHRLPSLRTSRNRCLLFISHSVWHFVLVAPAA